MKEEPQNHRIDPELEARIVAIVLDEASDLDRDQLLQILEERPELVAFKDKIASVHALMREVAMGELPAKDEDWKLSAEKRSAILAVISPEAKQPPAIAIAIIPSSKSSWLKELNLWSFAKIAAAVCVMGFFGALAISSLGIRSKRVASNRLFYRAAVDESTEYAVPPANVLFSDGAESMPIDEFRFNYVVPVGEVESTFEQNSKSAMWAIRDSLGNGSVTATPQVSSGAVRNFQAPASPESRLYREIVTPSTLNDQEDKVRALIEQTVAPDTWASDDWDAKSDVSPRYRLGDMSESNKTTNTSGNELLDSAAPSPSMVSRSDAKENLANPPIEYPNPEAWERLSRGEASGKAVDSGASADDGAGLRIAGATNGLQQGSSDNLWMDPGRPQASVARKSERTSEIHGSDGRQSGPQQPLSQTTPSLRGGTTNLYSLEWSAGGAAGGVEESPGFGSSMGNMNGYAGSGGAGGFGGGVITANERGRAGVPAPQEPAAGEKQEDRFQRRAPAKPQVAGKEIFAKEKADEDEDTPVVSQFDMSSPSSSKPNPTNQPMSGPEELDKLSDLTTTIPGEGEVTKRRAIKLGNGDPAKIDNQSSIDSEVRRSQAPKDIAGGIELNREMDSKDSMANVESASISNVDDNRTREKDALGVIAQNEYFLQEQQASGTEQSSRSRNEKEGRISPSGVISARTDTNADGLPLDSTNGHVAIVGVTPPILIEKGVEEEVAQQDFGLSIAGTVVLGRRTAEKKFAPFKKLTAPAGLNETSAVDDAFSTFSLHVSDVSFKLALAALAQGEWPDAAKVRIEEFVNAIDYGDPLPKHGERVACRVEQSIHPFLQQRNLLRVSMRTSAAGRASNTPLRLTLLLDNSGSMERIDRQQTVLRAFAMLVGQLQPIDQVTLISFARQPRLLADKVGGAQSSQLVQLIENLPSEGGTNLEAALQLAFEKAQEQQTEGAQNRIVLLTDGAVNLGDANPDSLSRMITTMRDAGIAFDAAGISAEGLNDEVLEALTRKGDGRYYLLDSVEAADDGFARQIAGALRPSAKNVKVQVEFNPQRVGRYKLLGFEKHLLKQEDFRNDQVDAAEMAAAEAGVAIYQFEAKPDGEGDVGSVSVRFRDLTTGEMVEHRWPIPYNADAARAEQTAPSMRIATCAALFAAKLRGDPLGEAVDLKSLSELISGMPEQHRNAKRVQQLQLMIEQARQVSGK